MLRKASHCGSWYSESAKEIEPWLHERKSDVVDDKGKRLKALICPHAGFRYSGPTASYSYSLLDSRKDEIQRVFVLGPSHHIFMKNQCALPIVDSYETPFGNLSVDKEAIEALKRSSSSFVDMDIAMDEDEHSIEMQLPFIAKCLQSSLKDLKLVTVMVGHLSPSSQKHFGELFAPFLSDPHTVLVISSDFCHYGTRFRYTPSFDKSVPIHQGIEQMDKEGMECIASLDPNAFNSYLKDCENTICGRNPIGVMMEALKAARGSSSALQHEVKWLNYAQSSKVKDPSDSSVSYAAAVVFEA